jgi:hypothetical protein
VDAQLDAEASLGAALLRPEHADSGVFEEHRDTFDWSWKAACHGAHDIVTARIIVSSADEIGNLGRRCVLDERDDALVSGYVQDEWQLVPRLFRSSRLEARVQQLSGFEVQPSGRFVWTPARTAFGAPFRAPCGRRPDRPDVFYANRAAVRPSRYAAAGISNRNG